MPSIVVLYPIEVPAGRFCWEHIPPHECCEHFSNEGGHSICLFGFSPLKDTPDGVVKAAKCAKLRIGYKGNGRRDKK